MFRLLLFCFLFSTTASFAQEERSLDSIFADKKFHVIQPRDNLYRIAKNHEIPLQELREFNNLNHDLIHPGDTLFFAHQYPATLPHLPLAKEVEEGLPFLTEEFDEKENPTMEVKIPHDQNLISSLSSTGFLNENMLVMVCVLILASFFLLFIIIISKKHKREEELTPLETKILMEQMNANQANQG